MGKKDYVLALLNKLSDQALPVRTDMIALIEAGILGDSFLDVLISIFEDAQKTLKTDISKAQIQKSLDFLNKIKATENKEREHNEKDIFDLDQMLDAI